MKRSRNIKKSQLFMLYFALSRGFNWKYKCSEALVSLIVITGFYVKLGILSDSTQSNTRSKQNLDIVRQSTDSWLISNLRDEIEGSWNLSGHHKLSFVRKIWETSKRQPDITELEKNILRSTA